MKYYGLKYKEFYENFLYGFAKARAKALSILPTTHKKFWQDIYYDLYKDEHNFFMKNNNSIPLNGYLKIEEIIISDLIERKDLSKLKKGIQYLLKQRRSNRLISFQIEGINEICNQIDEMDSTLLQHRAEVDCGIFELKSRNSIDYYSIRICNVNSAYLSIEFCLHLSKIKSNEFKAIVESDYHENRGYAHSTLIGRSQKIGTLKNYSIQNFNDEALKADKIYEYISKIEWEFMEELSMHIPMILHNNGIMPPRIELYYTNIDYRDGNKAFWSSLGVYEYQGQFIDERQKMFFMSSLSGRYNQSQADNRLIYIVKDDGIVEGQVRSVKDEVRFHLKYYANQYFSILFLDILAKDAGKKIVNLKTKLDKITYKRRNYSKLLKIKYAFSRKISTYKRYTRDMDWENIIMDLNEVYEGNNEFLHMMSNPFLISCENYGKNAISKSVKINSDLNIILTELDEKKYILQNLYDYKNTRKNFTLNFSALFISAMTLFLVLFPERGKYIADMLKQCCRIFCDFISSII